MKINEIPQWILGLDRKEADFLKRFILKSGSLKEIANEYNLSYPTIRLRLDKLINKINLYDKEDEESFETMIKKMAMDSKFDLETATLILEKYKKEKEHDNQ